jgi:hypothetical protein
VGIEIAQKDANRQEELSAFVNIGQILTGLLALAVGGHFVTKQFTFVTPFSRSLIAIVASLFEETYITKPKTSRPTNSEVYLVGKGFKGISPELAKALLDRCEAYRTLDKLPTTWGSLLQPDVLARADADILAAAQEVHGEQQVAFLNEIADAYRVSGGDTKQISNIYEAKAQKEWLNENPLIVIATDENLNHAAIEEAASYVKIGRPMPDQAEPTMQAEQSQAEQQQPELVEDSILIPEEDKPVEVEEPIEEAKEKKTIRFDL